jgi:hypothetical protein
MFKRIGSLVLLIAWSGCLTVRAQTGGSGDHPSNGVVELIATPLPASGHQPHRLGGPPEIYAPWDGLLEVSVRNISLMPVRVDSGDWTLNYVVEILDSSGKPVPMTEKGKTVADFLAKPRDPRGYYGPAYASILKPGQETTGIMGLSQLFQVAPGKAYTIKIKRNAGGLPKVNDYGKPLQQRELSCTVVIDERGVLR